MKINKVHCLFEQSGTFKNEFIKLGYKAEDYDIFNNFNQTDHVLDLFFEIDRGFEDKSSIFDNISTEDLIFAFFPCTRFEHQIIMSFTGVLNGTQNWSLERKLMYDLKLHKELHDYYCYISKLVIICIRRDLRLIIENPYSSQHYLTRYWCVKPKVIDNNRFLNGDYFVKPTQYWFINCEPGNNFFFEPLTVVNKKRVDYCSRSANGIERSLIHPQYANRFIKTFII